MSALPQKWLCRDHQPLLRVWWADRWWARARGLLGHPRLQRGEGLVLTPCNAVHGMGMTYSVDLLFLDREDRILRVCPLRPLGLRRQGGAWRTVECAAGSIAQHAFAVGQQLQWEEG